jgi:signal transduction histidine kinase
MIDMRVDGLSALRIDPDRFEQVVANLLINAEASSRAYTPWVDYLR